PGWALLALRARATDRARSASKGGRSGCFPSPELWPVAASPAGRDRVHSQGRAFVLAPGTPRPGASDDGTAILLGVWGEPARRRRRSILPRLPVPCRRGGRGHGGARRHRTVPPP